MPQKVCEVCKTILGNAYKFKQICKRSDTLLKMYPMTGVVPPKIDIPQEMMPARKEAEKVLEKEEKPEMKTIGVGSVEKVTKEIDTQTDPEPEPEPVIEHIDFTEEESPIIAPPAQFSVTDEEEEERPQKASLRQALNKEAAKLVTILNKSKPEKSPPKQFKKPSGIKIEKVKLVEGPKILNSQIQVPKFEEAMVECIETTQDGSIQIISYNEEYLDESEYEAKTKEEVLDRSDEGVVYSCSVCNRSFPLLQQLEIHRQNHDRERNHPCDSCDKSFFTKYDLAKHVLIHTKQKDYTCIICNKSFSRSTLLYRHEKIHTDPKIPRYKCTDCERVYLNHLDYEKHIVTHTKNRPFGCYSCDKRFAFKQGLERHQTIHDNESQPHPCQYCEMRFPSAARLQRHLSNDHAGTRPFPCAKCSKRFMLSHHLYRHMRTAHKVKDDIVSFQCPDCEQVFDDRAEFFDHCSDHAEISMCCPLCKVKFDSTDEMSEHFKLHSTSDMYFCDYCNLIYMNSDDLNKHFIDQHSNELCSVGEEIEYVIEDRAEESSATPKKRKNVEVNTKKPSAKKSKSAEMIEYDLEEDVNEDQYFEYINEDQFTADESGAGFVEYEEVVTQPQKTYGRSSKTSPKPSVAAKLPMAKQPNVKIEKVKMTQAKIEQLKKEGKIQMVNGEMVLKSGHR